MMLSNQEYHYLKITSSGFEYSLIKFNKNYNNEFCLSKEKKSTLFEVIQFENDISIS